MKLERVIPIALLAATAGCMATYRVSPAEYIAQHNPAQILVMDDAGAIYLVDGPQVRGDTLLGIESGTPDSLVLPVDHVEDALVKHRSTGKTAALIGGLTAGVGMAVFAIMTQGSENPCKTGNNKTNQAGGVIGGNSQCDTTRDTLYEAPF
jgi:hypothetical protein